MLNEKPHKNFDWKSRLGELDQFPGEALSDNHETWDKLHKRLHSGKATRKAVWYWVAAASLVAITMLLFVNHNQNEGYRIVNRPVKKDSITMVKSFPSTKKIPSLATSSITKRIIRERKISRDIAARPYKTSINSNSSQLSDSIKNENIFLEKTENVATNIGTADTTRSVPMTVVIKKKLKVVHINELGQPVEENYKGRYAEHQVIHLKMNKQDGTTPTLTQDLLKIKLTPQN